MPSTGTTKLRKTGGYCMVKLYLSVALLFLLGENSQAQGLQPTVTIDMPAASATISGTYPIAGWAIDNATQAQSAIKRVEVRIDGAFVTNASSAGRQDVCDAYPGRANCPNVGFVYYWNTALVANGVHT